ncbi:MAG: hypothetical protein KGR98_03095 [Verrucomicrobia bacterium]|nr:hypothetical protein [Verrucomicrobiota bacterium]MDE3098822.1 hypothetical protein [Verrucomicrobiota bacterium]
MKLQRTFLTIALAAWVANATAQQVLSPTVSTKSVETEAPRVITVFTPSRPEKPNQIHHYRGLSSIPWANRAGWHPGATPSDYASGHVPRPGLRLFTVKFSFGP